MVCPAINWFLCRNEVDIKRFVYNRHGGWHQICYVQDHYVNLFVIQVEIAQLFMCIATFVCKHEILFEAKSSWNYFLQQCWGKNNSNGLVCCPLDTQCQINTNTKYTNIIFSSFLKYYFNAIHILYLFHLMSIALVRI